MTKPTLLLVEVDLLVRMPLAEYLRECGFHVLEAATSEEARALLEVWLQDLKAVLIDTDASPDISFRLASEIRSRHSHIDVFLAGTPTKAAGLAHELCEKGPDIVKPYKRHLVLDKIKRLLAGRGDNRPADEEV